MKLAAPDTPDLRDARAREKTGKSLVQWFERLDALRDARGAALARPKQHLEGA